MRANTLTGQGRVLPLEKVADTPVGSMDCAQQEERPRDYPNEIFLAVNRFAGSWIGGVLSGHGEGFQCDHSGRAWRAR